MISEIVRALIGVGATPEMILAAVEAAERPLIAKEQERLLKIRERVRRCRERKRSVTSCNVTPPKEEIKTPFSSSLRSEAPAPPDARTTLFQDGLSELAALTGRTPTKLRPLLGRWLRDADDDALRILTLIAKARQDRPVEPIPWIERHLRPSNGTMRNGYYPPITDISKDF